MKRITALLTLITLICTLTACSKGGAGSAQTYTAEKLSNAAYKQEKLELPEKAQMIYLNLPFNGGNSRFLLGAAEVSPAFWVADRDFTKFERVEFEDFDIGVQYNISVSGAGEVAELFVHADYGDLPAPDPSSPDYDAALYEEAAEYNLHIRRYSIDGKLLADTEVADYDGELGHSISISGIAYDGSHIVANMDGSFCVFTADGAYLGELSAGEGETLCEVSCDSSGKLMTAVETTNGIIDIREVNAAECTLSGGDTYNLGESLQQLTCGAGRYSLFVRTRSTIYGIGDDGIEPLLDVNATNVNVNNINGFSLGTDGKVILCTTDYGNWKCKFMRFIPCAPSELGDIKKLRIGIGDEHQFDRETEIFLEENPDLQIERVVYSQHDEDDYNASVTKLTEDALAGNLPDIMITDYQGMMCGVDLADKGAFIDLTPFMDKDENLKQEMLFPNVRELITDDGKIYCLPWRVSVDMGYVCKKKWADKYIHGDWCLDTMMDTIESLPEGMHTNDWQDGNSKWDRWGIASDKWWIDAETATCNFDSDSFISYLRFCAKGGELTDARDIFADPMNPTAAEMQMVRLSQQRQYRDDVTMFKHLSIGNFDSYMSFMYGDFGGEEVVYLGLPYPDGAHTFLDIRQPQLCITKDSTMPDEAWRYISFIQNYDFETDGWSIDGFPLTEKGFFKLADKMRYDDKPQWSDQTENGYYWNDGENTVCIGPLRDEDIDFIYNCMKNAEVPPKQLRFTGEAYWQIVDEERQALFAGESTPEQCAKYMQDRIGTLLSERS
ncbi:MAG: extracellular solute-binding protein [Ruminococcus sp.]|nr:extracellular solute-binding protein [Ruminococcus sp.]